MIPGLILGFIAWIIAGAVISDVNYLTMAKLIADYPNESKRFFLMLLLGPIFWCMWINHWLKQP